MDWIARDGPDATEALKIFITRMAGIGGIAGTSLS